MSACDLGMAEIHKKSQKQEQRTADTYRGSRNAGSGSGWVRKNDVRSDMFLIENKFTDNKKSYSIKASDLIQLNREAILESRIPVLQFDLAGRKYVILTEDDFLTFVL